MLARRLRDAVLRAAVRGLLAPQDPGDEPAPALLERIRKEKERIRKENEGLAAAGAGGKGKAAKRQAKAGGARADGAPPFDLPAGWAWARLGDIVLVLDHLRKPVNVAERVARIASKSTNELFPYYGATGQVGLIDEGQD